MKARDPAASSHISFDDYADHYESLHATSVAASGEPTEYFARYKLDCLSVLGLDREQPILDYGAGIGNLTEQLVTRFTAVHAFDPSTKSLAVARRRAPAATFYDDAAQVPAKRFRTVVLSGVLHHVPRAERVPLIGRVREALARGGKVVLFEHNPLNPLTRRAVRACPFDDDAVLLWPREAKALLVHAGFSRPAVRYIVFFPRFLAKLRPWERKLGWFPAGAQWMMVAQLEPPLV